VVHTRCYQGGVLTEKDFPVEQVSEHLELPGATVWVDLCVPDQSDLELLADELQLHALALEDATVGRQRPKLDHYDTHLFLTVYQVRIDPPTGQLLTAEVAAFVTRNALVTVRRTPDFAIDELIRRWDADSGLAGKGVPFLLHGLLDFVVDSHFAAVQSLDDEIERLEDLVFDDHPRNAEVQRRSFALRKSLLQLRRVVMPMREVLNALLRGDLHLVDEATAPYLHDVYDHVLRVTEWADSLRDLVATILETNLTIQGNRLNTIMKQVTSWAAIIAVPTAVTGFYGQNVAFPGFGDTAGFWLSTALMVGLSGALYLSFRRRDWL